MITTGTSMQTDCQGPEKSNGGLRLQRWDTVEEALTSKTNCLQSLSPLITFPNHLDLFFVVSFAIKTTSALPRIHSFLILFSVATLKNFRFCVQFLVLPSRGSRLSRNLYSYVNFSSDPVGILLPHEILDVFFQTVFNSAHHDLVESSGIFVAKIQDI